MNKLVVSVFDDETKAFEGQSALKELHQHGDISLYASAVISKNGNGAEIKQLSEKGGRGTTVGLVSGAFIGLLAGPVGMAIGASIGAMGGMIYDINDSSMDASFVDEVAKAIGEGKTAVLADVDEGWTVPVDKRLGDLGGTVYRKNRSEAVDEQLRREAEATDAEIAELKEEWNEATDEAKKSIQVQIDKAKAKLTSLQEYASKKLQETSDETTAKIAALEEQMQEVGDRKRAKLEKRKQKLQAELATKKVKFDEVIGQLKEQLT